MKLSIIIATRARPDSLARLIVSLTPQLRPSGSELIVAENGTPAPLPLAHPEAVTAHIHDPRPGKCRVQNLAIKRATGDVLIFLDDDLIVADGLHRPSRTIFYLSSRIRRNEGTYPSHSRTRTRSQA